MSDDVTAQGLSGLPEPVRARVQTLTAEVLPSVAKLPAPLRKVADFAPARRARFGAGAMTAALEADDEFRERVAVQVEPRLRTSVADLVAAPDASDPVEIAAVVWLSRPEGWEQLLSDAVARIAHSTESGARTEETDRLRQKLTASEQTLRDARTRHREDLADLKAENATLRRKLGETRTSLKDAVSAAEEATRAAEEVRRQTETATSATDKEIRQLRARLERFEVEARADKRAARSERDEASLRARLLLEAVIDAATGLRRELSLPAVPGSPGDRLEAELALEGTRTPSSAGSMAPASPALLEQYVAMPRARLIVDGYNVSKSAWPSSSLEAQRTRLLQGLAPLVARTGVETTVVFDAAATSVRPVVSSPRGVKVLFSPEGVIADDVIRDLVEVEPSGRVVVVVTSDREVAQDVSRLGARVVAADALVALLGRAS